jgi:WD40 repeat protein
LWNTEGKNLPLPQRYQGKVNEVVFSPGGQLLIATTRDDGIISLWDDKSKKQSLKLQGYQGKLQEVVLSPDGQHLAVRSTDEKNRTISVWIGDTKSQELVKLQGDREEISTISRILSISPDGQHLALRTTKDKRNSVWLADTEGQPLVKLQADKISRMAFSPDSQLLVTAAPDGTIKLWDTKGQQKQMEKSAKHKGGVSSVAFSPDAQVLVTGGWDGTTRLWSIKGQPLAELQGDQDPVYSVAFSPNGKLLATSTYDYSKEKNTTLRLWQVGGMDELVAMNCDWLRDYLKNPSDALSDSDRNLCDGISPPSSSPKK